MRQPRHHNLNHVARPLHPIKLLQPHPKRRTTIHIRMTCAVLIPWTDNLNVDGAQASIVGLLLAEWLAVEGDEVVDEEAVVFRAVDVVNDHLAIY